MKGAIANQRDQAWRKIIHFEIERDGDKLYLCNQAVKTFSYKRTTDKDKVTCLNCLRNLKRKMKIHKQKPCGLVGDTVCGNFEKGDLVTNQPHTNKVTCPNCK